MLLLNNIKRFTSIVNNHFDRKLKYFSHTKKGDESD
jgi:hypothetical protein